MNQVQMESLARLFSMHLGLIKRDFLADLSSDEKHALTSDEIESSLKELASEFALNGDNGLMKFRSTPIRKFSPSPTLAKRIGNKKIYRYELIEFLNRFTKFGPDQAWVYGNDVLNELFFSTPNCANDSYACSRLREKNTMSFSNFSLIISYHLRSDEG